jgi:DNA polymerase
VGLAVVLHVHDEVVLEVAEDDADQAQETLRRVMVEAPPWAQGLPLDAEVAVMQRYGK